MQCEDEGVPVHITQARNDTHASLRISTMLVGSSAKRYLHLSSQSCLLCCQLMSRRCAPAPQTQDAQRCSSQGVTHKIRGKARRSMRMRERRRAINQHVLTYLQDRVVCGDPAAGTSAAAHHQAFRLETCSPRIWFGAS
jgi:hypothetical protein